MVATTSNVSVQEELYARMRKFPGVNWSAVAVAAWEAECQRQEALSGSCRYCGREFEPEDQEPAAES